MDSAILEYFSGKNIIITGAFNGIGRGSAQALLPICQKLYCIDKSKDSLEKFMQSFGSSNKLPSVYVLDITEKQNLEKVLNEICSSVEIDILFANAGIKGTNSFLSYD